MSKKWMGSNIIWWLGTKKGFNHSIVRPYANTKDWLGLVGLFNCFLAVLLRYLFANYFALVYAIIPIEIYFHDSSTDENSNEGWAVCVSRCDKFIWSYIVSDSVSQVKTKHCGPLLRLFMIVKWLCDCHKSETTIREYSWRRWFCDVTQTLYSTGKSLLDRPVRMSNESEQTGINIILRLVPSLMSRAGRGAPTN